jgi:hypothetical protein
MSLCILPLICTTHTTETDSSTQGVPGHTAASETKLVDPSSAEAVNKAYVWQRYLDLCDGRDSYGIIKFNGQVCLTATYSLATQLLIQTT